MPMTPYRAGYQAERRVAHILGRDGYLCIQSRGSHGLADIVALKTGQVLLVQVKRGEATLADDWWNGLLSAARYAGCLPIIADFPVPEGRRRPVLRLRQITGPHQARSRYWPCEPFRTDELADEAPR